MLRSRDLTYVLAVLLLIGVTYFGTRMFVIKQAPITVMETIEARIIQGSGGWNACFHNRAYGPRMNSARRANPDSIISSMAYDLSNGPARVSGDIWPRYWSMSLYQQNSDNFFVINDQQVDSTKFDFIISSPGQNTQGLTGTQVISPTDKGIMLIRRFAAEASDMPAILKNQDAMFCGAAS